MSERFTDELRRLAEPVWAAQHEHLFVRGIGDGTLDLQPFLHWVRQDYLFLIEYARLLSTAAARAPDLESMGRLAQLAQATLETEMALHRSYAARFGISGEELAREAMAPTCRAYTDFLVRVAATGDFAEVVGALLPCMWGFSELGLALKRRGLPPEPRYAEWVEMYASPEFTDLAEWCRGLMDRTAEGLSEARRRRVTEVFLTSSRYEYLFWEMAWRQERWPV